MEDPRSPDLGFVTVASDAGDPAKQDTVSSIASADTMGSLGSLPATADALPRVAWESYSRIDEFARGGLGRIIRAIDKRTGRTVAIKEMLADNSDAAARFVREALVTANLQHPAIVPVYEVGRWPDDKPFYAMKLVVGRPFNEVIDGTKNLDGRLALLSHVASIADALAYAHEQRVIHRDLKPHNVLCGTHGETVVIDWGLARRLDEPDPASSMHRSDSAPPGQTQVGTVLGTPSYMAPEQARGERADERTDVYAIGSILYHLLSGRPPHTGKTIEELLERVKDETPPTLTSLDQRVPRDLAAICARAMARSRDERYPSAAEYAADLLRFMTGQLVLAHHYSRGERIRRFVGRHRALLAVAGIALGIFVVLGAFSIRRIVASEADATVSRDQAQQRLVASHVDRAGVELVAGHADRALAFTIAAGEAGEPLSPASRLIAGQALAMLPAIRRRMDPKQGSAAFVPGSHDLVVTTNELVRWNPDTDNIAWRVPDTKGEVIIAGSTVVVVRAAGLTFVNLADGKVAATVALSAGAKPVGLVGRDRAGAWLAVVSDDRIDLVDTATRSISATISISGVRRSPVISPDGQHLAVIRSKQNTLESVIVDRAGNVTTLCDCGHVALAGDHIAFVPMGSPSRVAVADWSGSLVREMEIGVSPANGIAVDPTATRIAIASNDGTFQLRDLSTGKAVWQNALRDQPFSLALDANRAYFVSSAQGVVVLDANSGSELARVQVAGTTLVPSDDGTRVAIIAPKDGVSTWTPNAVVTAIAPTAAFVNAILVTDTTVVSGSADGTVAELRDGKVRTLASVGAGVTTLEQAPDGALIIGALDDRVTIREPDGKQRVQFKAGQFARISADGKLLATFDVEGRVALWDVRSGNKVRELGKIERALHLTWSRSGQVAAIGSDGTAVVWNVDGSVARRIKPNLYGQTVTFSHDGKWLALGAGGHTLYAIGGGPDRELRGTPGSANTLIAEFSADDSKVVLAGTGFMGIWNVATGEPVFTVATSALMTNARFVDGERYIAGGGGDRRLRLWDASTGAELLSVPVPGNMLRLSADPSRTTLGITTARGTVVWKLPLFDGDLATLRRLAECRSSVEIHESHVRGRAIDDKVCNRR